jgi:uncharacterized protein (TIGR00297 family)
MLIQLIVGLSLGILVGLLAWRLGSLSRSGALAAALTGGLTFGLGGFRWAVLLLAFFMTSSAWSRAFRRRKAGVEEKYAKGSRRDWGQVMANGGLGAVLAVLSAVLPGDAWPWLAFGGAMAAVNADTWATELGIFNPSPPRLITTGKTVERGTSGGVTPLGYLAALGGSALIGLLAALFSGDIPSATMTAIAITLAGIAGSTFDSLLGATIQAIYFCPRCQKETERFPRHGCGTRTIHRRGWRWLDNDWVNASCSLVGALAAWGIWAVFN